VVLAKLEVAIAGLSCGDAGQENGFDIDICRDLLYVGCVVVVAE
jgi:hypothetical protein